MTSADTAPLTHTKGLWKKVKALFMPPFQRLDRLLLILSGAHLVMAVSAPALDFLQYHFNFNYVTLFLMCAAALLFFVSYVTIPLTVAALVWRWRVMLRTPCSERMQFHEPGMLLLLLLQSALAVIGWNAWNYFFF